MAFHKNCAHCYSVRILSLVGLITIISIGTGTYAYQVGNGITNLEYGENIVDYTATTSGATSSTATATAGATSGWYTNTGTGGATATTSGTNGTTSTTTSSPKPKPKPVSKPDETDSQTTNDTSTDNSSSSKKTARSHMLINGVGVGDTCRVSDYDAKWYVLNEDFPALTQNGLEAVMKDVFYNDRRLRRVRIYDDQIDMYYLQPATFLGMPVNYLVHVKANSSSWKFSVDHGSFIGWTDNKTDKVANAFKQLVPVYLTAEMREYYADTSVIERDSKVLEIANQVMYQVPYKPHEGSFFVCYIMPYLIWLLLVLLLVLLFIFFFYRRYRKITHVHHVYDRDIDEGPTHEYTFLHKTTPPVSKVSAAEVSWGNTAVHVDKDIVVEHKSTHDDKNDGFTYKKTDFSQFK